MAHKWLVFGARWLGWWLTGGSFLGLRGSACIPASGSVWATWAAVSALHSLCCLSATDRLSGWLVLDSGGSKSVTGGSFLAVGGSENT